MSRNKSLLAVAALAAIVVFGCQLQAQTVEVAIAGSSAQWQTQGLGAYNGGSCGSSLVGATAPCYHYTYSSFNLTDTRVSPFNVDGGAIWVVWDSSSPAKVWASIKVDSGVGVRCYFANPACKMGITSVPSPNGQISSVLWGGDTPLPNGGSICDPSPSSLCPNLQALFTTGQGVAVNVAATDIRPEDALWATCRTNSSAGMNPTGFDSTDGLGYNGNFAPGICAPVGSNANGQGNSIKSGYPSSTSTANVLAFAISGKDPISGGTVPKYSTYSVGIAPIIFVYSRNGGQLSGLTNVTESQVQTVFGGTLCDASAFGLPAAGIAAYLREPLSGTMNTTEATVFRRPVVAGGSALGVSQETGVNGANPLTGGVGGSVSCPDVAGAGGSDDGKAGRWRGIGTGEAIKSVLNSKTNNHLDGITYTFFSYGNVSSIANSANYAYTTLDGVDGVFYNYNTTSGAGFDPGQPANGELPAAANLPSPACGTPAAVPCPENAIWALNGLSFPNIRSGAYRAWSNLRVVSTGTALTNAEKLILSSQKFVVNTIPDYIPAVKTTATVVINGVSSSFTDPGATLLRSHYQQVDGSGASIGPVPHNKTGESGGDMGGCIVLSTNTATQLIQANPGGACATRATNP